VVEKVDEVAAQTQLSAYKFNINNAEFSGTLWKVHFCVLLDIWKVNLLMSSAESVGVSYMDIPPRSIYSLACILVYFGKRSDTNGCGTDTGRWAESST
jgi:hypothetical protein